MFTVFRYWVRLVKIDRRIGNHKIRGHHKPSTQQTICIIRQTQGSSICCVYKYELYMKVYKWWWRRRHFIGYASIRFCCWHCSAHVSVFVLCRKLAKINCDMKQYYVAFQYSVLMKYRITHAKLTLRCLFNSKSIYLNYHFVTPIFK